LTKCSYQFWTISSMRSFIQKNEIKPLEQGTTCKFQNYIEKVDRKHYSMRNWSRVHSFGHPLYVWQGQWHGEVSRCYWQNRFNFLFIKQCYKHFHYCFHDAHNNRSSCSVERLGLRIVSKHITQCKGHSKGCRLLMWWRIFQISFHRRHEVNIYYKVAVQVWIVHGKSMRGSNRSPKPSKGACAFLCLPFF